MNKTNFDNKITNFNKRITSNKATHLEVQKKPNSLIIKDYNFFLDWIYFTSNDGFQKTFVYQPTVDTLELKKDKGKGANTSKLKPLYTTFLYSIQLSEYGIGI